MLRPHAKRLQANEEALAALRAELATLRGETALDLERTRLLETLASMSERLAGLHDRVEREAARLDAVQATLGTLTSRLDRLAPQDGPDQASGDVNLREGQRLQQVELAGLRSSLGSVERQLRRHETDLGNAIAQFLGRPGLSDAG